MRSHMPMIVAALVVLGCSDSAAPPPPRITGSWDGVLDASAVGFGMCPLPLSISEDDSGNVTGTANLSGSCGTAVLTVTGTTNTGGVADSVELHMATTGGALDFAGTFDGSGSMLGLTSGGACATCPTSFTRTSMTPLADLTAWSGTTSVREFFPPERPRQQ